MTTTSDTATWKAAIETAFEKIEEGIGILEAARNELDSLGERIEEEVDSMIGDLDTATTERDEFEKERDALQEKLEATL